MPPNQSTQRVRGRKRAPWRQRRTRRYTFAVAAALILLACFGPLLYYRLHSKSAPPRKLPGSWVGMVSRSSDDPSRRATEPGTADSYAVRITFTTEVFQTTERLNGQLTVCARGGKASTGQFQALQLFASDHLGPLDVSQWSGPLRLDFPEVTLTPNGLLFTAITSGEPSARADTPDLTGTLQRGETAEFLELCRTLG